MNQIRLRVTRGETVLKDTTIAFQPDAVENRIAVSVDPQQNEESVQLDFELTRDADPLFRGSGTVAIRAGDTAEAPVELQPVPAGVAMPPPPEELRSIGETIRLAGAVVFATGDTITGLGLQWSTAHTEIVAVAEDGVVEALSDGDAAVTGSFGDFSGSVTVRVRLEVAAVVVDPDSAMIAVGETLQLTAIGRDANGNPIPGRVPDSWTSSNTDVASVDATGLVTARAAGTAQITARIDGGEGSASIHVVAPPPIVSTRPPERVGASQATLVGEVNPNGIPTEAWFEWGTSPALGNSTTVLAAGDGNTVQTVSTSIEGLDPRTDHHFRLVARNAGGTVHGETLGFRTGDDVPGAPRLLAGTSPGSPVVDLTVIPGEGAPATEYRLERAYGLIDEPVEFAVVSPDADFPTWADSPGGGTFRYRVRACAGELCSEYSGTLVVHIDPTVPLARTEPATRITHSDAQLNGMVQPNGLPTYWWFEYDSGDFEEPERCLPQEGAEELDPDTSWQVWCEPLFALQGSTTYAFRLGVENDLGQSYGETLTFMTQPPLPPTVVTGSVDSGESARQYSASVEPNGATTEVWFEISNTSDFEMFSATDTVSVGYWNRSQEVSIEVEIAPTVVYYLRAVGRNSAGITLGSVMTVEPESRDELIGSSQGTGQFPPLTAGLRTRVPSPRVPASPPLRR